MDIQFKKSPNYTPGRGGMKPLGICVHRMQGSYQGSISWFLNKNSGVSSHYLVSKSGQITQMVDLNDTAWTNGIGWTRAGQPTTPSGKLIDFNRLGGLVRDNKGKNPNSYMISVELDGYHNEPVTDAMYNALIKIYTICNERYGIPIAGYHIIGHNQINPVDKPNCPGSNFNTEYSIQKYRDSKKQVENPEMNEQLTKQLENLNVQVINLQRAKEVSDTQIKTLTEQNQGLSQDLQTALATINNQKQEYEVKIAKQDEAIADLTAKLTQALELTTTQKAKIEELEITISAFNNIPSKPVEREVIRQIDLKLLPSKIMGWFKRFQNTGGLRGFKTWLTHIDSEFIALLGFQVITYLPIVLENAYNVALPHVPVEFSQQFSGAYIFLRAASLGIIAKKKAASAKNSEYIAKKLAEGGFLGMLLSNNVSHQK